MALFIKFPSIAQPERYGYIYNSESFILHTQIDMRMLMFQTLGDGQMQHSGAFAITREYAADYLHSLAEYLLTDQNAVKEIGWHFADAPRADLIAFAATVKYDGTHAGVWERYYSLTERKVTKDRRKQHDKRYEAIQSRHDGSCRAIFNMLFAEYGSGLQAFVLADAVRDWLGNSPKHGYHLADSPASVLGWAEEGSRAAIDLSNDIRSGVIAVRNILDAYRLRDGAASILDCYRHNLGNRSRLQLTA